MPLAGLNESFPQLVAGIETIFGLYGPYAAYKGSGLDAQAISAASWVLGEPGRAPLSLPPGIAEHQSGAMLAAGCLLALCRRDEGKGGRIVDIALADVLASYVAGNYRFYIHHGLKWERNGRRASGSGGAYPFVILPSKNGMVCICSRTREEWDRLVHAMGDPEWASQPRYQRLCAIEQESRCLDAALAREAHDGGTRGNRLEHGLIVSPLRDFA